MTVSASRLPDPDMENASLALERAAKRAKELARQTGTEFVVMRDGKLVREIPQPASKEQTDSTESL
jgi:hypothetical protein